MNRRMNKSPPVFYRTLSPSGPLPKKKTNEKKVEKVKMRMKMMKKRG